MQFSFKAVVLLFGLSFATTGYGWNLGDLICGDPCGCGNGNCCDGCEPGCGCEPGFGCEPGCGCEASCGGEPSCGCGAYCVDGRQYAGQTYNCCGGDCGPPMCACTGPSHCGEPSCGCGCGDECCEPSCGCESSCGCEDQHYDCGCTGLWRACGRMCSALCGGCNGCSSEAYWCEWHNDPPRCCDPCDRCGNWVGPSGGCGCECGDGGYSAPYDHPYSGGEMEYHTGQRQIRPHGGTTYTAMPRPGQPSVASRSSGSVVNPYTKARAARTPVQGTQRPYQR